MMLMPRHKYDPEEGFVHPFLLIAVVALVGLMGSANISTTREFTRVLGEGEESKEAEEQQKEAQKKQDERQKETSKSQEESQKKQEEQKKEDSKSEKSGNSDSIRTETVSSTGVKSKTQTEGKKSETEIETPDGQKIKTKVEDDGTTKVEVEHGQLKLKYVLENGQIKLKAENEQGQEVELKDEELEGVENEIENELGEDGIEIATGSGKPILTRNNVAALTDFPLSVDVGTNRLIVTTPAGQKVVTVLPDQAVQNLLATNIVNKIGQVSDTDLTSGLENLSGVVKLEIRDDEVVYRVKGTKTHRLLGFILIDTTTTVFVSTDTGQPVAQERTVLTNIIDLLSP